MSTTPGKKGKGTSKTIVKNWFDQVPDPDPEYTEWDTEIYPKGLYDGLIPGMGTLSFTQHLLQKMELAVMRM